jgi:hypothetical protein
VREPSPGATSATELMAADVTLIQPVIRGLELGGA